MLFNLLLQGETMPNQEIIKELRKILKVYWYDSDKLSVKLLNNQHMSKDVATNLENLLGTILKGEKLCQAKKQ